MASALRLGGQRSGAISLLICLCMDHCFVKSLLEDKKGRIEKERRSELKGSIHVGGTTSSVRAVDTIFTQRPQCLRGN